MKLYSTLISQAVYRLSLLPGKLTMLEISHFVRNDIQWFYLEEGLVGGKAANQPLFIQKNEKTCHSDRSEES
jgi:hypothetical protein